MTLTKAHIVEAIQNDLNLPRKKVVDVLETLLELVKHSLENGEEVLVTGFGKFCVKEKAQRSGVRNITTGEELTLAPRRVVTFKCSGKLREKINQA